MRYTPYNPFYRDPSHPNFNRRAFHHDYTAAARYLITICKNASITPFCTISGNKESIPNNLIEIRYSNLGATIPEIIEEWQKKYPIFVDTFAIMPDHIHLCVNVISTLTNGLGRAIASLKGMISKTNWLQIAEPLRPTTMEAVFCRGFNDRIAYSPDQWQSQRRYTADNPRRYLIKKLHPDYLYIRWLLTLPDNRRFILRGNIFLLRQPSLFLVKTSRKFTSAEQTAATEKWRCSLYNGEVPISPFIHPHEKGLRDIASDEGYSYIRVCTNGFGEREYPGGREFDMMASGRLLLIGREHFCTRREDLSYEYAHDLNRLSLEIAEACNSGLEFCIREIV